MVTDLSQLHQNIHHAHEIATFLQSLSRRRSRHELFVDKHLQTTYNGVSTFAKVFEASARNNNRWSYLSPRQLTFDNVLKFPRQLSFDILLQATKHKRPNDSVKATNDVFVLIGCCSLNHTCHWVRKPIRKLLSGPEDVRHEEMKQRPELCNGKDRDRANARVSRGTVKIGRVHEWMNTFDVSQKMSPL